MSQSAIERIREQIYRVMKAQLSREPYQTSILSDDDALAALVQAIDGNGKASEIQIGTNSNGQTKFMVGVSTVGGADVVG